MEEGVLEALVGLRRGAWVKLKAYGEDIERLGRGSGGLGSPRTPRSAKIRPF